ncbi:MAG TPA: serine/threonine-protein kinase, partial [Polyangiales bacterium]|nr:serine/threonine-protein kinase [Polyangiales bacterium]
MSEPDEIAAQSAWEDRFEFEELLGSGAMGTVYRALDRTRGTVVAVKQLKHVEARALFNFKAEFRKLVNLSHPNLLQLYELVARGDDWLLTMELVEGTDFLRYVRPSDDSDAASASDQDSLSSLDESTDPGDDASPRVAHTASRAAIKVARPRRAPRKPGALDEARLRRVLGQLAEGLRALHAQDYLHRDLKPDNVLVFAETGRLVICDFGLVIEAKTRVARKLAGESTGSGTSTAGTGLGMQAGTLAFMAPEQANGMPLSEAADWYAVGVMLYMALTLQVPIAPRRTFDETARAKLEQRPRDPRELNPDAPADLSELALALLAPDASERAGYERVRACVASRVRHTERPARASLSLAPRSSEFLLGRAPQLAQLNAAFARARAGHFGQVFVSGRSGMGKSALVRHFLQGAEANAGAIVLAARCYEREELPYKAFDPLVDALSAYLFELEPDELTALLPTNVDSLAWVFPTLRRLKPIEERMHA